VGPWAGGPVGDDRGGGGQTTIFTAAYADALGSVRMLTDAAGVIVGTQDFDPFGVAGTPSGGTLPLGSISELTDPDSKLVHLRAREYAPDAVDKLANGLTLDASTHAYAYAGNNPLRWTDPRGLLWDFPFY
jgi:RHS repeat-associated protein